jgi:hypothetical protein
LAGPGLELGRVRQREAIQKWPAIPAQRVGEQVEPPGASRLRDQRGQRGRVGLRGFVIESDRIANRHQKI